MMRRTLVLTSVLVVTAVAWCAAAKMAVLAHSIVDELDRAKTLADLAPRPQATIVYDRHDRPAFTFFIEQRIDVPLDRVSPHMIDALLSVEDRRFFSHHGIDPIRIAAAAWRNFRAGRIVEGGSTITQQLARASAVVRADLRAQDSRNSSRGADRAALHEDADPRAVPQYRSTWAMGITGSKRRRAAISASRLPISSRTRRRCSPRCPLAVERRTLDCAGSARSSAATSCFA